jgi:hypothetical protein
MILFDASNRDECEIERERTNTPLQALLMLNDPTVLEASRTLAAELLQDGELGEAMLEEAFRRIVGRRPDPSELAVLTDFLNELSKELKANPEVARKLLQVGDSPVPDDLSIDELAALMQVIHTVYNMEETITKS